MILQVCYSDEALLGPHRSNFKQLLTLDISGMQYDILDPCWTNEGLTLQGSAGGNGPCNGVMGSDDGPCDGVKGGGDGPCDGVIGCGNVPCDGVMCGEDG